MRDQQDDVTLARRQGRQRSGKRRLIAGSRQAVQRGLIRLLGDQIDSWVRAYAESIRASPR